MSVSDRELIDRYLAGKLDEAERDQLEVRIVNDAVFRKEVELTESLREGLHELEARGDLAAFARPSRRFWQRPAYALAASVAAGLFGLTSLALYQQLERVRGTAAALTSELGSLKPGSARRSEVLRLARVRSAADEPDLVWSRSGPAAMVDLRLDAGLAPVAHYEVALMRVESSGDVPILVVQSAATSADGEVSVSVNSALLLPGEYRVRLAPHGEAGSGATLFSLRVLQ